MDRLSACVGLPSVGRPFRSRGGGAARQLGEPLRLTFIKGIR